MSGGPGATTTAPRWTDSVVTSSLTKAAPKRSISHARELLPPPVIAGDRDGAAIDRDARGVEHRPPSQQRGTEHHGVEEHALPRRVVGVARVAADLVQRWGYEKPGAVAVGEQMVAGRAALQRHRVVGDAGPDHDGRVAFRQTAFVVAAADDANVGL